jgi:hypothetical protein
LATISSTFARPSSGVFASEPGLNLLPLLELLHVVLVEIHAGRGGHAVERVLAQLRIARRRADVAVAVDDARHDEFAGEVDHRRVRRRREARRHLPDAAVLHHDRDIGLWRRAGAVDHGGMGESGGLRRRAAADERRHGKYD